MSSQVTQRLFVGGLTADVTEAELKQRFSGFGAADGIEVIRRPDGKVFAYPGSHPACAGVKALGGTKWKGSKLRVEKATPGYQERLRKEREEEEARHKAALEQAEKMEDYVAPPRTVSRAVRKQEELKARKEARAAAKQAGTHGAHAQTPRGPNRAAAATSAGGPAAAERAGQRAPRQAPPARSSLPVAHKEAEKPVGESAGLRAIFGGKVIEDDPEAPKAQVPEEGAAPASAAAKPAAEEPVSEDARMETREEPAATQEEPRREEEAKAPAPEQRQQAVARTTPGKKPAAKRPAPDAVDKESDAPSAKRAKVPEKEAQAAQAAPSEKQEPAPAAPAAAESKAEAPAVEQKAVEAPKPQDKPVVVTKSWSEVMSEGSGFSLLASLGLDSLAAQPSTPAAAPAPAPAPAAQAPDASTRAFASVPHAKKHKQSQGLFASLIKNLGKSDDVLKAGDKEDSSGLRLKALKNARNKSKNVAKSNRRRELSKDARLEALQASVIALEAAETRAGQDTAQ
eukprot:m51a1_g8981 hypothetical protein (513) ;mRNA; r:45156-46841